LLRKNILPVGAKKGRSIKTLPNGTGNKTDQRAKSGKAKVKAKAKGRKVVTATVKANLCATIGARGMGTAAMPPPATSLMMVLKEVPKEKGKEQQRYRRKPLSERRKKSWQW
jgi:hypothetical protein